MSLLNYLPLLAGIGLFLYGMSLVSSSLEKLAGANLERTLEKLTNSKIKGVTLGAVITAVIQSSAATTVMVVGFLNAGIMKLVQAVPVIMGANIGTTITAQILRLSDIEGTSLVLSLLKPSSFAPVLILVGACVNLTVKKSTPKHIALICIGLGSIFFGMNVMETTLSPLADMPAFQQLFLMFQNPILGVIVGAVVTALLQSSSASVGLLQALTTTGAVSFASAVPIIMGQNIGTCFTVFLASIGANKNAKRAVFFHLFFNIAGTAIFLVALYGGNALFSLPFWNHVMNRGDIANFHSLFNIANTIILLPFTGVIINISKKFIKSREQSSIEESLAVLDQRFLTNPALALEQANKVLISMGSTAKENFGRATELLFSYNDRKMQQLEEYEDLLDRSETTLGNYMVQIAGRTLSPEQGHMTTEILHTLGDFERIGDYAVNIAEVAQYNSEHGITFSARAQEELRYVTGAVGEIIDITVGAYVTRQADLAAKVEPLEQVIDSIIYILKNKHVDRLQEGKCTVQSGISFIELLTNLERISDHCSNVAVYIIKAREPDGDFDAHAHLRKLHGDPDEVYKQLSEQYEAAYLIPLELMESGHHPDGV